MTSMPQWHWLLLLVAIGVSALLTLLVRSFVLTTRYGLSAPRDRDVHKQPIPRLGGVAISITFLLVVIAVYGFAPDLLHLSDKEWFGFDRNLVGIIAGVVVLLIVGIVDDIKGLNAWVKLFWHFVAGAILASSMVLVPHITNPFGGQIELGLLAPLFVVLWVVALINVINWLDGLDGLASGVSLIATIVLYILAVRPEINQMSMSLLALVLAGSLIGFLPFNFFPARIFLGDSGSQVLGFLLAVFAIISGGKLATAFLVLGVPILDVVWVIARRLSTGTPIYQADGFHLHHRLLKVGLSQKQAVILLYTLSAAFGIVALQTGSYGKFIAVLVLIAIMVLGGFVLVSLSKRKAAQI